MNLLKEKLLQLGSVFLVSFFFTIRYMLIFLLFVVNWLVAVIQGIFLWSAGAMFMFAILLSITTQFHDLNLWYVWGMVIYPLLIAAFFFVVQMFLYMIIQWLTDEFDIYFF